MLVIYSTSSGKDLSQIVHLFSPVTDSISISTPLPLTSVSGTSHLELESTIGCLIFACNMLNCGKRHQGHQVFFLYSIIRLGSRQLIRASLQALALTGKVQTAFVEKANLTLRELIAPLSRRIWSIAHDTHHLGLHIHWGLAYYHFCRPHQSLTLPIRDPSQRRYRTLAMAANLVNRRLSVRDLLQLSVPEGVWLDPFSAMKGCR